MTVLLNVDPAKKRAMSNNIHLGLQRLKGFGYSPAAIADIGAYEGWFSTYCRMTWPEAYIFMVEAMPEKESVLRQVAAKIGNCSLSMNVLGGRDGEEASFFVARGGSVENPIMTGSSLYPEKTGVPLERRSVRLATLDSVAPPDRRFDFLKLDVQGGELDVLSGAPRCVRDAEMILLEVSILQYNEGSPLIAEVISRMKELGFVVFDIFDIARTWKQHLNQIDLVFIRQNHPLRFRFPR